MSPDFGGGWRSCVCRESSVLACVLKTEAVQPCLMVNYYGPFMKKWSVLFPLVGFLVLFSGYEIYTSYKGHDLLVTAHVVEGLGLAAPIKVEVVEYYNMRGEFPASNAELGLPSPRSLYGQSVKSVEVSVGGKITVTYKDFLSNGASITLTPFIPSGYSLQSIEWACTTETIGQSLFDNMPFPCFYSPPGPLNTLMDAISAGDETQVHATVRDGVEINGILRGDTPLLTAIGHGGYAIIQQLIAAGADVNLGAQVHQGLTPLMYAAVLGRDRLCTLLLDHGADVDAVDNGGKTALMHAVIKGQKSTVGLLLSREARLSQVDKRGRDVAYYAQRHGRRTGIDNLIESARQRSPATIVRNGGAAGASDLMRAAGRGDVDRVLQLVGEGASIDATDSHNATALHYALRSRKNLLADVLIEAGIGVNIADRDGNTPLLLAVKNGVPGVVDTLLKSDAEVNVKNRYFNSPLLLSIRHGYKDVAELLLSAGAHESAVKALQVSFLSSAPVESIVNIQRLIVDSKLAINHDTEGLAALLITAIKARRIFVIRFLLEHGAGLDLDVNGLPLHVAVQGGDYELVRLLLEKGANIEIVDKDGRTALMFAVKSGQSQVVKLLLDAGANIDTTDVNGLSALRMAKANYSEDIVELLRRYKRLR